MVMKLSLQPGGRISCHIKTNGPIMIVHADAPSSGDDEDGEDVAEDTGEIRVYGH